ncbi:hypothetical protein PYW08_005667 [Mythimna loreyi]|uniref:Uncharacterized protein n=1 Tax=Mythimna loreyi TaxID=667449 RepID=A0ACC2QHV1_9NEOP|nr:hypothetical protein PYW08_005667 [Mythimna loreyi]
MGRDKCGFSGYWRHNVGCGNDQQNNGWSRDKNILVGHISKVYTTVERYPTIKKLKDLYNSGAALYTSDTIMDIIRSVQNPEDKLQGEFFDRVHLIPRDRLGVIMRHPFAATVDRKSDAEMSILEQYSDEHGNPLIDIVEECFRTYYLTYIARTGFPFYEDLQIFTERLNEAGLPAMYYKWTQKMLEIHNSMADIDTEPRLFSKITLSDQRVAFGILFIEVVLQHKSAATVDRKADAVMEIFEQYSDSQGNPLIDVVDECFYTYYLSFITRPDFKQVSKAIKKSGKKLADGYPVTASIFRRHPTSIETCENIHYYTNLNLNLTNGYCGLDGMGHLNRVFTTVKRDPQMKTLQELYSSGITLHISPSMKVFMKQLLDPNDKLQAAFFDRAFEMKTSRLGIILEANAATVDRKADAEMEITQHYLDSNDSPMIDVLDECFWTYYLSYIARTGFPFYEDLQVITERINEAGLPTKYYKWTREMLDIPNPKNNLDNEPRTFFKIKISDDRVAFQILFVGTFLSLVVFAVEMWKGRQHHTKFYKRRH